MKTSLNINRDRTWTRNRHSANCLSPNGPISSSRQTLFNNVITYVGGRDAHWLSRSQSGIARVQSELDDTESETVLRLMSPNRTSTIVQDLKSRKQRRREFDAAYQRMRLSLSRIVKSQKLRIVCTSESSIIESSERVLPTSGLDLHDQLQRLRKRMMNDAVSFDGARSLVIVVVVVVFLFLHVKLSDRT